MDQTLAFRANPYGFINERCQSLGVDAFSTRLFFKKTICMTGKDAAELFYNTDLFVRKGAQPEPIRATLFGKGGVQGLDGKKHRHRKAMIMSIMTEDRIDYLGVIFKKWLSVYAKRWERKEQVNLYQEMQEILCQTAYEWVGIDIGEVEKSEIQKRTRELSTLFDSTGSFGLDHFKSRLNRKKTEFEMIKIIKRQRRFYASGPESPLSIIAFYKDLNGDLLPPKIAAVEVLSLLRPTIAVSVYLVFIAHALHFHPGCRDKILANEEGYLEAFAQEVRRYYPFFPATIAKVAKKFEWNGLNFQKGERVILDLFGTNHDPRYWNSPERFMPERFYQRDDGLFDFIPQGGGYHQTNHRCPGEEMTIKLMRLATEFFTRRIQYEVPTQNLEIDKTRLPALPKSQFLMKNIKALSPFPSSYKRETRAESNLLH